VEEDLGTEEALESESTAIRNDAEVLKFLYSTLSTLSLLCGLDSSRVDFGTNHVALRVVLYGFDVKNYLSPSSP
jgi:hypothetical protein